jgi:hypothetical protein
MAMTTFTGLSPDDLYDVAEDLSSLGNDYIFEDLTCTTSSTISGATATGIVVEPGLTTECIFENAEIVSLSRTQGFWSTHKDIAASTWSGIIAADAGNCVQMGIHGEPSADDDSQCLDITDMHGAFWMNIKRDSEGNKRSLDDKMAAPMVQQLFAGLLNNQAFGTYYGDFLDHAIIALGNPQNVPQGTTCNPDGTWDNKEITVCLNRELTLINEEGSDDQLPDGFNKGKAEPQAAQAMADIEEWDIILGVNP